MITIFIEQVVKWCIIAPRFEYLIVETRGRHRDRAGIGMEIGGLSPVGMDFRGPGRAARMPILGFNDQPLSYERTEHQKADRQICDKNSFVFVFA